MDLTEDLIPEGDWRHGLPEDMRGHTSIADFKLSEGEDGVRVPSTLVKSYIDQQPLIGGDKIPRPKEGASEDEWTKYFEAILPGEGSPEEYTGRFLKAIGKPEKADDYDLTLSDELKGSIGEKFSERLTGWFRAKAHEVGLPKGLAEQLYQDYIREEIAIVAEYDEEHERKVNKAFDECMKALNKEWGADTEKNLKLANRAYKTLVGEEQELSEELFVKMANNPNFCVGMFKYAQTVGEHNLIEGVTGRPGGVKTKEELDQMRKDPRYQTDQAYFNMVQEEYRKAFPGEHVVAPMGPGEVSGSMPIDKK